MGQRDSINLYYELNRLEAALLATAEFTVPHRESTAIVLPSGRGMALPFSRCRHRISDNEDRIVRSGELGVSLGAVLQFLIDSEIQRMSDVMNTNVEARSVKLGMFDFPSVQVGVMSS